MSRDAFATLMREQQQLLIALESAADTLIGIDEAGYILCISAGASGLIGYAPAELTGEELISFVHADDRGRLVETLRDMRSDGERIVCTYRMRHKDGRHIWTETSFALGTQMGAHDSRDVIGVMRDISWRAESQSMLETVDLWLAARDAAEAANRAKAEFLARMSQDHTSPDGMSGFAKFMRDGTLDTEQREQMTQLHDAGTSLIALFNELADLSMIEAGKLVVERLPPSPRASLKRVTS